MLDNLDIHNAEYGVWRPVYKDHAYASIKFDQRPGQPPLRLRERRPPKQGDRKPLEPGR